MSTVEKFIEWKTHPNVTDNARFTVEAYNKDTIKKLNWDRVDVLYSFLGMYAIGLTAYYPDEFEFIKDGISIKDSKNKNIYSLKQIESIMASKQKLYKEKKLKKEDVLDFNPQLIQFIEKYFSIGNVIPVWPGANMDRGRACMYDIPELYFSKYEVWTRKLNEIYGNAFLDDLLDPNLVFENKHPVNYNPPFWNFSSTKDFLDNMADNKFSKDIKIGLYSKWLERIVGIIEKRKEQIQKSLS